MNIFEVMHCKLPKGPGLSDMQRERCEELERQAAKMQEALDTAFGNEATAPDDSWNTIGMLIGPANRSIHRIGDQAFSEFEMEGCEQDPVKRQLLLEQNMRGHEPRSPVGDSPGAITEGGGDPLRDNAPYASIWEQLCRGIGQTADQNRHNKELTRAQLLEDLRRQREKIGDMFGAKVSHCTTYKSQDCIEACVDEAIGERDQVETEIDEMEKKVREATNPHRDWRTLFVEGCPILDIVNPSAGDMRTIPIEDIVDKSP